MRRISALVAAGIGAVLVGPSAFGPGASVEAASPLKVGSEFGVNATTPRAQYTPDLAALPDGRVMAVWADGSFLSPSGAVPAGTYNTGITGATVASDGVSVGDPVVLMRPLPGPVMLNDYAEPQVHSTATSLFQTALHDQEGFPSPALEYVTAATVGSPRAVPDSGTFYNPSNGDVVGLSNGNVAVVTAGRPPDAGSTDDVRVQVLTTAGVVAHGVTVVNAASGTAGGQDEASASAAGGGVVVAFRDRQSATTADDVTVVRTDEAGAPLEFALLPIAGVQRDPDIATLPQGGYVVVFVDENAATSDGSGSAVRARFVSAAGMPGTVVTVNSTTAGDQTEPAITALPDGRVFVAWTDASGTEGLGGSGSAVRGQLLDVVAGALVPDGVELLVNTYTAGDQDEPAVVITSDGRVAVAWTSASGVLDPDGTGISMQLLDPREAATGAVGPSRRVCFAVAGAPGDVAVVNLTPVNAAGLGNGQLVSSDVVSPPVASNVNFSPGSFDPNVAFAPIGADGTVCFVNSAHTSVDLVADHLGTIDAAAFTFAGAAAVPRRIVDTRVGTGGTKVAPSGRLCATLFGTPGDVAVVNLTPVEAEGWGNGQLVSSDVMSPPVASNVNFSPGSIDPNVAFAPIGTNATVVPIGTGTIVIGGLCYVNSVHTSVHLVADHLGAVVGSAYTTAGASGAPVRVVDTRVGLGGARVGSSGRVCFAVAGSSGDVAVVNLTPVNAGGLGNGQLVSSDVVSPPVASNVNFSPGSFDPNVALAPIGVDGRVCFVNSVHTSVDLVADHLGTIRAGSFTLASTDGASRRVLDTRAA